MINFWDITTLRLFVTWKACLPMKKRWY